MRPDVGHGVGLFFVGGESYERRQEDLLDSLFDGMRRLLLSELMEEAAARP